MKLKRPQDLNLKNKPVIFRVGYDVPLKKRGKSLVVADDTRIQKSLPTLEYLIKKKSKITIITWLKRPNGKPDPKLKLDPIARHLQRLIGHKVHKVDEVIGTKATATHDTLKPGQIMMLENVRFHSGEKKEERTLSKELSTFGESIVFDAFSHAHRKAASTTGILKQLPSAAGFHMQDEIQQLSRLHAKTKHPYVVIIGGAKIEDKLELIEHFLKTTDHILLGGALAHPILHAMGVPLGKSLVKKVPTKKLDKIIKGIEKNKISIPTDLIAKRGKHNNIIHIGLDEIPKTAEFVDLGPRTIRHYTKTIRHARTIFWNGPLGLFEVPPFDHGTKAIAQAIAKQKKILSIIGGGDTERALKEFKLTSSYTHVSTGGGASLEYVSTQKLPVLKYLEK